MKMKAGYKADLLFNILVGQVIAICIVSGGIFTQNISNHLGINIPIFQLSCLYLPLNLYLVRWLADFIKDRQAKRIPIYIFLGCAIVDIHATLLIVFAFNYTSITSVMIIEDFTIPSAFLLSVFFLKIKYNRIHFFGLMFCIGGMSCSLINDVVIKENETDNSKSKGKLILGDMMALAGAFLYAFSNILQERYLKSNRDIFHYLGFLGLFGTIITLLEAYIFNEFSQLRLVRSHSDVVYLVENLVFFGLINLVCYSLIPHFVQRSGATMLNISNVTTVIWSMLSDMLL